MPRVVVDRDKVTGKFKGTAITPVSAWPVKALPTRSELAALNARAAKEKLLGDFALLSISDSKESISNADSRKS